MTSGTLFGRTTQDEEDHAFQQFLTLLGGLDDFCIYHYGSYESAFLRRMRKQARRKTTIDTVLRKSVNILSLLRSNIYFPTYSNGLKDIGASLDASGRTQERRGSRASSGERSGSRRSMKT